MQRYILRRIGQAIITLFILGLVVFLSVRVVGDPGVVLLGIQATAKEHEQLEKNLGLHDPLAGHSNALLLGSHHVDHAIRGHTGVAPHLWQGRSQLLHHARHSAGVGGIAGMLRLVRSSMLEVLDSEYVKFARVKGVPERMVIYKHALKNAGIPALTYGGLVLASLLNG